MLVASLISLTLMTQDPCGAGYGAGACDPVAHGQEPIECRNDWRSQACADAEHSRRLAAFGLPGISVEAATGAEFYRAFYVDGYGQDMPVVIFERRDGAPPKVAVVGLHGSRIEGVASADAWAQVVSGGDLADRTLSPPERPEASDVICLHPWTTTIEIANSRPEFDRIAVRTRSENNCEENLTSNFGQLMARLAVASLPSCALLDGSRSRNGVTLLETCLRLEGDTMAAAELLNHASDIPYSNDRDLWRDWLGWGNVHSRVEWAGEMVQDPSGFPPEGASRDVAAFLAEKFGEATSYLVSQDRVAASSARDVTIEGEIVSETGPDLRASYRQVWQSPDGFGWQMLEWVIEPFSVVE